MSSSRTLSAIVATCVIVGGFALSCGGEDAADVSNQAASSSSGSGGMGDGGSSGMGDGGMGGSGGEEMGGSGGTPYMGNRRTISGDITWNVSFDAEALGNGASNCSYTRHYEGAEDSSAPWLCPQCEVIFRADVQMTAGQADCFSQVTGAMPAPEEWIGYGAGNWWRSGAGPMSEQGTATVMGDDVTSSNSVMDLPAQVGGTFSFNAIDGVFSLADETGDPARGFRAAGSYDCGWPKPDPPAYTGDYTLVDGQLVPDGLFKDKCDQVVRLHDFKGSYLVIDMSAIDCPPCQTMAAAEEQFVDDMAAQGITVYVISLLAPSLTDVFGDTTTALLNNWVDNYMLTSPVLNDRAWGQAMFGPLPNAGAYPSWVIVDPELNVIDTGEGFGSFQSFETTIVDHLNGN